MRKLLKLLTVTLTLAALLCGLVLPASAYSRVSYLGLGESQVESRWQGVHYTDSDLFGGFKNLMPGDIVTETVSFGNFAEDSDYVNLYFRFVPHDEVDNPPVIGGDVAEMNDFLSQLTMRVFNGDELMYEGPACGFRAEPLPRTLTASPLSAYITLGTIFSGDEITLTIELSVPTFLNNTYANRVGEVDIAFLVETFQTSQLTVRKVWSDGNDTHAGEEVAVNLLKNGKVHKTVKLNSGNGWVYTFDKLGEFHTWTVEEADVPAGYTVDYETNGNVVTITNTKVIVPVTPTPTPVVTPTPTPVVTPTPTPVVTPTPTPGGEPTPPGGVTPTPPGGVTPTPPGGVTPTPPGGVTPTPPGGVTPTPPGGVTPTPPGGVTPTPPGSVTPTPPGGVTPTPPGGVTPTPPGGVTPTPPGGVTPTPPGGVTPTPPGGVTPTPTPGVTPTPPGGVTPTPPGGVTPTPPGGVTPTPPTGVTPTPPGSVTPTPPGSVTPTPPGGVSPTPPTGVTPTPPGGVTPTPPTGVTPTPPGSVTPTPPGSVTPTPPGSVTPTPPGGVTPTPPGGVTPTPPGGVTPTPPGSVTPTPPGSVTPTPPGGVTPTPPGGVTPTPPGGVTPTPPGGVTPTPPGGVTPDKEIHVIIEWSDGNDEHEGESVDVVLIKDDIPQTVVPVGSVDNWDHTFEGLDPEADWTVDLDEVPDGYTATVTVVDEYIYIHLVPESVEPTPTPPPAARNITVEKKWSDRDGKVPGYVYATLYNGTKVHETVVLSSANGWKHTWTDLDGSGNWQVLETNIPKGYTPTYSVIGDVVTITNSETLIQTGQNNLGVVLMGGCGVLLLLSGLFVIGRRKKEEDA